MSVLYPIHVSGFYKLCIQVLEEVRFPMHFFYRSKKMYGNFVHCFLLVYKERLNLAYRPFVEVCEENNLAHMLCIKRIPHFSTLQKFMQKIDKTILERMVRACNKLLKNKDIVAGIDGTGFSNNNPSHYYQKRIDGVSVKNYTKTVLLADLKTKLILNMSSRSDNQCETLSFIPLVKQVKNALSVVLADKAYDSMSNRQFCWNSGITTHIPFREQKQQRKKYGLKPGFNGERRRASKLFNPTTYRQRALIESVNSALKRTLGSWVCSRKPENQQKQATIKAIAYNLQILKRAIKAWVYISYRTFLQRL
jgi:hypothetical protein